jgi:N utilization substance protein A
MNKETIEALRQIEKEKNIPFDLLIEALEDALHSAYLKTAHTVPFSEVKIDRDSGEIRVFELIFPPGQEPEIEDEETEIDTSMAERQEITPEDFGRIAAQTAKQVIYQRIREAEQGIVFHEYSNRLGEIVTGIVQQSDSRYTLVDLGRVEARLPKSEQVPTERYEHGMRLKAVIKEVSQNPKEPPIILSRRSESWCGACSNSRCLRFLTAWSKSWEWRASRATARRFRSFRTATALTLWAHAWVREGRGYAWWSQS